MELLHQDKLKEACGVFGIYDPEGSPAAHSIYMGLNALQHRGQESCGIAICDTKGPKGNMDFHKGMGLVSEVFKEETLHRLQGNLGVGHVRYSTTRHFMRYNTRCSAITVPQVAGPICILFIMVSRIRLALWTSPLARQVVDESQ